MITKEKKDRISDGFWAIIRSKEKVGFYQWSISDLLFKSEDDDGRESGLEELLKKILSLV